MRITAANQLVEHGKRGEDVAAAIRSIMRHETPARQRVHGLWVLQRLGAVDETIWLNAATDPDRKLRVHHLKTLIEWKELPEPSHGLALHALGDADPFVRRAAAEALGTHPALANVRPLLALRQATSADDTHLVHVARMALRDQLKTADVWNGLATLELSERDRHDIADVALGVPSPQAATYLLAYLQKSDETPEKQRRFIHHIARYGPLDQIGSLTGLIRRAERHDHRVQAELIKAAHQGFQERGAPPGAAMHELAVAHARSLLDSSKAGEIGTWGSSWPADSISRKSRGR